MARYGQMATPEDILRIARDNFTVDTIVKLWRDGRCTWEQAMMIAVVELARQHKLMIPAELLKDDGSGRSAAEIHAEQFNRQI